MKEYCLFLLKIAQITNILNCLWNYSFTFEKLTEVETATFVFVFCAEFRMFKQHRILYSRWNIRRYNKVYEFFININIILNIWWIQDKTHKNCKYVGSLLLRTQLELNNTSKFENSPSKIKLISRNQTWTRYWKCRATVTGLLCTILHLWN